MLTIDMSHFTGKHFHTNMGDQSNPYLCVGYGQNPKDGVCYFIGKQSVADSNNTPGAPVTFQTVVRTYLFKDVIFLS
jgi:hypothetical protein